MNISNKIQKIKFLFIRLSSMGDIILTTPLLRAVKQLYPEAQIDYLVAKQFADVLRGNPYIDNLILYDKSKSFAEILALRNNLKNKSGTYDFAIDLQNNLRSIIFRSNLAKKIYSIPKRRLHKLCLTNFHCSPFATKHVVDNYFSALSHFNVSADPNGLEISISETAPDMLSQFPPNSEIISIAPGAAHFTKRFPVDKFIETINLLFASGYCNFALLGGETDTNLCQIIKQNCKANIVDFSGKLNISQTAKVISISSLLITNDTGVMHIGAAIQTPLIAIFGSTTPSLGFYPYKCVHSIIEVPTSCRPCTHIGRKQCPKSHFKCMNDIKPSSIAEAALILLA